jgi:predicted dehydrogenase
VVSDYKDILADPSISSVVICSETVHHIDLVVNSAKAGKAIFCEKPIGLRKADSQTMAAEIEKANVLFQTGFFMRSSPVNQFIKTEVAAGHLGKLVRAHYSNCHGAVLGGWFDTDWRWLADISLAGGGGVLDLGAHILDLTIDTFVPVEGKVKAVSSVLGNRVGRYGTQIDEFGTALLEFESGFSVTLDSGWADSGPLSLPTGIFGTEGQILVQGDSVYYQSKHVDGADGKTPLDPAKLPAPAPHAFEIFWDAQLGKESSVRPVPVQDAAYGSEIMEQIYEAAGRKVGA